MPHVLALHKPWPTASDYGWPTARDADWPTPGDYPWPTPGGYAWPLPGDDCWPTPGGYAWPSIDRSITYHPYWIDRAAGIKNPRFDDRSGWILNLKRSAPNALQQFYNDIEPLLGTGFAIAIVPSHNPQNSESGIRSLAQMLARHDRIDATTCLQRFCLIRKLSDGGDRGLAVHLNSIRIENGELVQGVQVLLMDDVMTTGNSLDACSQLLIRTGAVCVQRFALARTIR